MHVCNSSEINVPKKALAALEHRQHLNPWLGRKKPRKQASTWGWTVAVHGSHGTTSWKGSQKSANKWTQVIPHKNYQPNIQNPFYMNACHCRFNSAQGVLKVFSLEHASTNICRPLAWAPGPEANIFLPCSFTPPESYGLNKFQLLVQLLLVKTSKQCIQNIWPNYNISPTYVSLK